MPGVTVGEGSIIAVNSTVTRDVPAGEVWGGSPAKLLMTVDDYRRKIEALDAPVFDESLYSIGRISKDRKDEMIRILTSSKVGLIKK